MKSFFKYIIVLLIIPLIFIILIFSLFVFFDKETFLQVLTSERTFYALKLSVLTATVVSVISVVIAIPVSYLLSRKDFYLKSFIDILLEIPLVVSPAALGAMILIFFNTKFGKYIQNNFIQIVFSVNGIIFTQFIATIGVAIRLIKSVMDEIPHRYEDIARTLGANSLQTFRTIILPLSKNGIFAAFILTWAKCIGEFGATMTVAGTTPMHTETLPIAIYLKLSSADIKGSVALILITIIIGISALVTFRYLNRKSSYYD